MAGSRDCPECGASCSTRAITCDCGYNFARKRLANHSPTPSELWPVDRNQKAAGEAPSSVKRTSTSDFTGAIGFLVIGIAVVSAIGGGASFALDWWNKRERAAQAWGEWQRKVCVVSKIGSRETCRRCKATPDLLDEALTNPAISEHLDEFGGVDALKSGVDVCK